MILACSLCRLRLWCVRWYSGTARGCCSAGCLLGTALKLFKALKIGRALKIGTALKLGRAPNLGTALKLGKGLKLGTALKPVVSQSKIQGSKIDYDDGSKRRGTNHPSPPGSIHRLQQLLRCFSLASQLTGPLIQVGQVELQAS